MHPSIHPHTHTVCTYKDLAMANTRYLLRNDIYLHTDARARAPFGSGTHPSTRGDDAGNVGMFVVVFFVVVGDSGGGADADDARTTTHADGSRTLSASVESASVD